MSSHVDLEGFLLCEFLVTLGAGEGLETHVSHLVSLTVALGGERLVAHGASEGAFSCVDPSVGWMRYRRVCMLIVIITALAWLS